MKKKDVIKIESIQTPTQAFELCDWIARKNKRKFNFTKLAEELNELSDLCLKYANKTKEYRPSKEKFIEEIGDVIIRLEMLTEVEDITLSEVNKRILYKANKFLSYLKQNKYMKGI